MSNSNKPFGFRYVGSVGGGSIAGKLQKCYVSTSESSAIYIGDPVKLSDSDTVNDGCPAVELASSGNVVYGVVVGLDVLNNGAGPNSTVNLETKYRVASTAGWVLVQCDPNGLYEVQSDSTGLAATAVGRNATYTASTGSTTTGVSNAVLTGSTIETTAALGFQVLEIVKDPTNELGATATTASPYVRVIGRFNQSNFLSGSAGTVGV